jgi:hypothetical protein
LIDVGAAKIKRLGLNKFPVSSKMGLLYVLERGSLSVN